MCVGELRELVVPSQYGYGEFPVGDKIPPRALLVFYVELLKISDPGEDSGTTNMFKEIDVNGDGLISHSEVGWCELGTEISTETISEPFENCRFFSILLPRKFRISPVMRSSSQTPTRPLGRLFSNRPSRSLSAKPFI